MSGLRPFLEMQKDFTGAKGLCQEKLEMPPSLTAKPYFDKIGQIRSTYQYKEKACYKNSIFRPLL